MARQFQQPNLPQVKTKEEALLGPVTQAIQGLPNTIAALQQYKLQKAQGELQLKQLQRQMDESAFNQDVKTQELGLRREDLDLSRQKEDRMSQYQAELLDIKKQLMELQGQKEQTKQSDRKTKEEALLNSSINQANRVIEKTDQALEKVSGWSTGWGAKLFSNVPKTNAKALANDIKSIKANLGFAQLQEMRRNSPTGGALGQVAVQELDMLQSTVESLDQELDGPQLREALNAVKKHYENWKQAVTKSENSGSRPTQTGLNDNFDDLRSLGLIED